MLKKLLFKEDWKDGFYFKNKIDLYLTILSVKPYKSYLKLFLLNFIFDSALILFFYTPLSPIQGVSFPNDWYEFISVSVLISLIVMSFYQFIYKPYKTFSDKFNTIYEDMNNDIIKIVRGEMTTEEFKAKHIQN